MTSRIPIFIIVLAGAAGPALVPASAGGQSPTPGAAGGEVGLQALPEVTIADKRKTPKNVARWHMGAGLLLPGDAGVLTEVNLKKGNVKDHRESVLLGDDETLGYLLREGEHTVIIDLTDPFYLERCFFENFSAAGRCEVSLSARKLPPDHKRWRRVGPALSFSGEAETVVDFQFPVTEAQFVKLRFTVEREGEVSNISVLGTTKIADTDLIQGTTEKSSTRAKEDLISYDFASLYSGTAVSHVTSGTPASTGLMIDDDLTTFHEFAVREGQSVIVVDLSTETQFNTVSMNLEAGAGTLEVYLFSEMPEALIPPDERDPANEAGAGVYRDPKRKGQVRDIRVPADLFDDLNPEFVLEVEAGQRRVRHSFTDTRSRFVLFRWIPRDDFAEAGRGIRVFEVSVLGDVAPEPLVGHFASSEPGAPSAAGATLPPSVPIVPVVSP